MFVFNLAILPRVSTTFAECSAFIRALRMA